MESLGVIIKEPTDGDLFLDNNVTTTVISNSTRESEAKKERMSENRWFNANMTAAGKIQQNRRSQ